MKILWFTWKDLSHPHAGGAELVNEELAKRLVADGHEVTFIVGGYKNASPEEISPAGYKVIRVGGHYSLYWQAFRYYNGNLKGWADLIIDEINTVPFFAKYYAKEPVIMFAHMLCRKVWFYQLPLPLSLIGYLAEPLYLRLINAGSIITVSDSTRQDLLRAGFKLKNVHIISEGIQMSPLPQLPPLRSKSQPPAILSFGHMRPMKRTLHQIEAFNLAKQYVSDLQLWIAGDTAGRYGQKVLRTIQNSPYADDITYHGPLSPNKRLVLMREAHLILQTSIKEGWGLTVTEAASQGTPAVVYDADGLRDSVRHGETGLITEQNNPQHLANAIVTLLTNPKLYTATRKAAWQWSKTITFNKSYQEFKEAIRLSLTDYESTDNA